MTPVVDENTGFRFHGPCGTSSLLTEPFHRFSKVGADGVGETPLAIHSAGLGGDCREGGGDGSTF